MPYPFEFQLLEEDWDHFAILMDSALHRIPALAETGIKKFYNGPESFTPDNQFILGEAPGAARTSSSAPASTRSASPRPAAPGGRWPSGSSTASPTSDLTAVDIRRFAPFNGNNQWLHDRVGEVLGLHYAMPWPNRELTSARPFRRSPAAPPARAGQRGLRQQDGLGAGQLLRAAAARARTSSTRWGQPNWLPWSTAEQRATRTAVAVFDQTIVLQVPASTGPDADGALQWLCTADVAVPPGRTVYTGMLNARGTYESDLTVTRLSAEEFLLVSSSATTERDQDHITRRMPAGRARVAGRRDLAVRRARGDGAPVARPAGQALPR